MMSGSEFSPVGGDIIGAWINLMAASAMPLNG
jgi:hypothetical protein